jgi:DNA repair protein RadC
MAKSLILCGDPHLQSQHINIKEPLFCGIKALPLDERPRERLERDGIDALSHAELIAIVLGNGTQGKSVLDLSQELLEHFGGLEKLLDASIVELMQIKGIGKAKAILLKAVFGLALKCRRPLKAEKYTISSAKDAYDLAQAEIAHIPQEVLLVILRDVRGNLIHFEKVSMGTLSQVLVHPREVFHPAVRYKAYSLIIAHNHLNYCSQSSQRRSKTFLHRFRIDPLSCPGKPSDGHPTR